MNTTDWIVATSSVIMAIATLIYARVTWSISNRDKNRSEKEEPILMYQVIGDDKRMKSSENDPKVLFWNPSTSDLSILDYELRFGNTTIRLTSETYLQGEKSRQEAYVPIAVLPGQGVGLYFPYGKGQYIGPDGNIKQGIDAKFDEIAYRNHDQNQEKARASLYIVTSHCPKGFVIELDDFEIHEIR